MHQYETRAVCGGGYLPSAPTCKAFCRSLLMSISLFCRSLLMYIGLFCSSTMELCVYEYSYVCMHTHVYV